MTKAGRRFIKDKVIMSRRRGHHKAASLSEQSFSTLKHLFVSTTTKTNFRDNENSRENTTPTATHSK
jgi:hypothetical protein